MKNIIKKSSMLTALGVLAIVGIASAAVITTYVSHTGTADISQAVTWGNGDTGDRTYTMAGVGGSTYVVPVEKWNIENNANNPVDVKIVTKVVDELGKNITKKCVIEHEVNGDGVAPYEANPLLTELPALSGDLPFWTEITLPTNYSGVFTITTKVNPVQ